MINYNAGAINTQTTIQEYINKIETTLICVVNSINVERQTYNVTPVLNHVNPDGSEIQKATIIECPFAHSVTSQFGISNPFSVGDYVVVSICKDSIEESLTNGRSHSSKKFFRLLDGVVVGGILKTGVTINGLSPNELKIYSRTGNANIILNANGQVTINADDITINGNTRINGNLDISGTSTASDHISSGISGSSHAHGGVQTGGGNTGGPI